MSWHLMVCLAFLVLSAFEYAWVGVSWGRLCSEQFTAGSLQLLGLVTPAELYFRYVHGRLQTLFCFVVGRWQPLEVLCLIAG